MVGKGGRSANGLAQGRVYKIKSWGGTHFLTNIDNINVRIASPKSTLSGNIATYKLPTGETVRKVQLEYYIEETNTWKLKNDASTMWPKSWDIHKIKEVIKEASNNILEFNGINKFRGLSKEGYEIEFYIDGLTNEITTAYLYFD
ncbi:EndoU domain-containing protein [Tenacibaculum tangerinum]|uniref:EndoU domain-containing protein n=1 Tax=Tenacibaculum tangerinum TaxID=3038772 RepID=A0ABY8L330_9FLAO|nr:EndoU domain-containing protein [Tenacibaculum tangerinum]WGH74763.1 EndoU domain-containing protein [Tenacibaculum tangerinum]